MPTNPKQRSLELPPYLTRILPLWQSPQWLEAERWRQVVANQPVAMNCRIALVADILSSQFEIRARDSAEEDALADEIDWYTDVVLNPQLPGGLSGFDNIIDQFCQDLLTLPIGGNLEPIRFPDGQGQFSTPHGNGGHVARLVYIDGATLWPTYDYDWPIMQRLKEDPTSPVFFKRSEIARAVMSPRTEIQRWGFGMPPPEAVYLGLLSLYHGDRYYASLLVDTPEAGILDLIDMSKDTAKEWASSFSDIMSGIDPMKIGLIYEHLSAAKWIPFGRPPTDLILDKQMLRYSQITTAGYGLTIADIGLGDPQKTLAGTIRDERRSRRSGFGALKEKVRTLINSKILPQSLEFIWIGVDEETKVQQGRAFLLIAQALEKAKTAGLIDAETGLDELKRAGHISPGAELPEPAIVPPQLMPGQNGDGAAQDELDQVPASEGGREKALAVKALELGDERIAAVPKDSSNFDKMAGLMKGGFADIVRKMGEPEIMRLVKAATRALFPVVDKAIVELSDAELPEWYEERLKAWFDEPSEFDALPDVKKANGKLLGELDDLLDKDDWWKFDVETPNISFLLKMAFEEGATTAAEQAQAFLYTEGLRDSPNVIGLNFNLTNPATLAELERDAAIMVRQVDKGTRFFLKRIITSSVEEGLSSPSIAELIREGAGVEEILKTEGYTSRVLKQVKREVGGMSKGRANSIVNTEINRAESTGRLKEWEEMGLTRKSWNHSGGTGPGDPCPVCEGNISQGLVEMGFLYDSVFGDASILTPPAHPTVDHCHLEFDEQEMLDKADTLNIWLGD